MPDTLTLPMQDLRGEIAEIVKQASDKDTAQELSERNSLGAAVRLPGCAP